MGVVTLLTDFGTADGYVGEMKGVILSEAPGTMLVDISHELTPHDVELGRLTVARYWRRFPHGTVHLAVVDPGVGSERAAIAVESDGRFLVGPDNGLLSPALLIPGARVVALPVGRQVSATFHGRDVFAPAAARLALGNDIGSLGAAHAGAVVHRTPEPRRLPTGELLGQVLTTDRFGNAVTNLLGLRGAVVLVGDRELPLVKTYANLGVGEAGAVVGSTGLVEVVVREGRASDVLGLARGTPVTLR